MEISKPILLILGIVGFLIILLSLEGVMSGNWQTISQNIAPIAVAVGAFGLVLVIIRR